jgi:hypothetical protein
MNALPLTNSPPLSPQSYHMQAYSQHFESFPQETSLYIRPTSFEELDISHDDAFTAVVNNHDIAFPVSSHYDNFSHITPPLDLSTMFSKPATGTIVDSEDINGTTPISSNISIKGNNGSATSSSRSSVAASAVGKARSGSTVVNSTSIKTAQSIAIQPNSRKARRPSVVSPLTTSPPPYFNASSRPSKSKFTEEDDTLLIELKEHSKMSWRQIAEHFNGRTPGALQVRYCTKLKARTPWTEEDLENLKAAVDEYEAQKWTVIAEKLGNKHSAAMCRKKHRLWNPPGSAASAKLQSPDEEDDEQLNNPADFSWYDDLEEFYDKEEISE